jgi:hypothetical protein
MASRSAVRAGSGLARKDRAGTIPYRQGIRVASREELAPRILQGVRDMNLAPIVMRWKKFGLGLVNA